MFARSRDKQGRSHVLRETTRENSGSFPPLSATAARARHAASACMAQFRGGGRYAARTGLTSQHRLLLTRLPCCAQNDEEDPDDYYAKNSETQKLLMRDQDDTLKMLGSAVDRVQSMARQVNQELSDQNQMLDTIDDEVDKTESKLASVHKSLKMLANDTDRGKYCVICLLIVLLVWLVMMVLD